MAKGFGWARHAAVVTTGLLSLVFAVRASISWKAVIAGEPKLIAASLISSMLVASLILLPFILRKSPKI